MASFFLAQTKVAISAWRLKTLLGLKTVELLMKQKKERRKERKNYIIT